MEKYLITLVKGDDRTVLEVFDTKEAAMVAGISYRRQIPQEKGLIGCISSHLAGNGQPDLNRYRIHRVWC